MKIVITSVSSAKIAKNITKTLLEKNLAACIHFFIVNSAYIWNSKQEQKKEWVLHIKSKAPKKVISFLEKNHEYMCPMIYSLRVHDVNPKYKKWLNETC